MTISYKKLWIMCAEKEMSKAELRRRAGLSPATLTKLRRNAPVSMEVLMKQENLDARAVLDASDPSRITYREDPALELPVWATDSMP